MSGPLTGNELLAIIEGRTTGEISVSEYTALNLSAVWCAVVNIAGTIGKLPLILYRRRDDGGRDKYDDHSLYRLLHDEPHPEMGAMVFRETLQQHVLLWGNGYAEIQRDGGGRVAAFQLLTPNRVTPKRDERTMALYYEVANASREPSKIAPRDMLHVRGLSFDGVVGYSVVGKARVTLTLGMQTERFGSSLFSNGPKWSGVLQHPKSMSPEAKRALRADLKGLPSGDYPMFEEGITWIQTGMPAKDAEFLATRQFQVDEIARWFNIPPHKLKELMRATFSNIEHQGIDYLTDTIDPWLVKWEEEINRKVIAPLERKIQYAEFLREALTQADLAAKHAAYKSGIDGGYMNPDEVREKQNMNPIPGGAGKKFRVPANMLTADQFGEMPPPQPAQAPAPPPADDRGESDTYVHAIVTRMEDAIQRALPPMLTPVPPVITPSEISADQMRAIVDDAISRVSQDAQTTMRDLVEEIHMLTQAPPERPMPEPEPAQEPEPEPEPEDDEYDPEAAQRHAQEIIAQRMIIADVVRRMLAHEKDKARGAAKTPERLRTWVQDFYPRHMEVFSAALLPAIQMHVARTKAPRRAEDVVRELVLIHCDESQRGLRAILDRKPSDLAVEVQALVGRWVVERINVIPDAVMQEEIAHHG